MADSFFQFSDRAEGAATQPLVGDLGKPAFDLVEPRTAGRRKVQMIARSPLEPGGDLRRLVCAVVVQHQMNFEVRRHRVLNLLEETQELLMAMTGVTAADDFAGGDVQGREERGGAVAVIIMRATLRLAGPQRQDRLAAVQRLNLALLVDTQDNRTGLLGRIEIEPHDVAHLLDEERIARELEVLLQMRLQPKRPPDAHDGILRKTAGLRHRASAPMRGRGRLLFQRAGDDRFDFGIGDLPGLPRTRRIAEAGQPVRHEALPPLAYRRQRHGTLGGDCRVAQPARAIQHDPGAQRRALIRLGPPGHRRQLRGFFRAQYEFHQRSSKRHHAGDQNV